MNHEIVPEITLELLLHPKFSHGFAKNGVPSVVFIGDTIFHSAHTIGGLDDCTIEENKSAAQEVITFLSIRGIDVKGWKISHITSAIVNHIIKGTRPFFNRLIEKKIAEFTVGGRTQVLSTSGEAHLCEYDMKEAYPRSLATGFPCDVPYQVPVKSEVCDESLEFWSVTMNQRRYSPGTLPIRLDNGDIEYPQEGKFGGIYLFDEIENAVSFGNCTIQKVHAKYRVEIKELPEFIIWLNMLEGNAKKTLKYAIIRAIGTMYYQGGGGHRIIKVSRPRIGDMPIVPEQGIYSRREQAPNDANPYWYRPLIASTVWAKTRSKLIETLFHTVNPISIHVDGILAPKQEAPPHTREKEDYGLVSYECPWKGALFINDEAIKTPGVPQ